MNRELKTRVEIDETASLCYSSNPRTAFSHRMVSNTKSRTCNHVVVAW